MPEPLASALTRLRGLVLDDTGLVRAVGTGRQKSQTPTWRRVELRYVDLRAGRRLQVTAYDDTQAHTSNHEPGATAGEAVDALLDERACFPIPLSIRACGFPAHGLPMVFLTWLHRLRVANGAEQLVQALVVEPGRRPTVRLTGS